MRGTKQKTTKKTEDHDKSEIQASNPSKPVRITQLEYSASAAVAALYSSCG